MSCFSHVWERPFGKIDLHDPEEIFISKKKSLSGKNEQDESPDDDPAEESKNDRTAPCRGLKPYKDIEDLLYQIYINLDSDCLFVMPIQELDEIWDTDIWGIDFQKKTKKTLEELEEQPCNAPRDALFIRRLQWGKLGDHRLYTHELEILPTIECDREKGGWFDRKKNPLKMLPPLQKFGYLWGWESSDKARRILFHRAPSHVGGRLNCISVSFESVEQGKTLRQNYKQGDYHAVSGNK